MGNQNPRRYPLLIPSSDRNEVLVNILPDGSIELPVADILFEDDSSWEYYVEELEQILQDKFGTATQVVRRFFDVKAIRSDSGATEEFNELEILLAEFTEEYRVLDENLRWVSRDWAKACN